MIEGNTVELVAMRNAKPSQVAAVVAALRGEGHGRVIKTEARDGTTQPMPVSFATSVADCARSRGSPRTPPSTCGRQEAGTAKRVGEGLAGPDMTLGTEAMRRQWSSCSAPELVVGADDVLTWGLVFDLATTVLGSPGSRANAAVLITSAAPGHKLVLP